MSDQGENDFFSDSRRGGTGRLAELHKIERGELPPCGPPELVALWHIKKANESLDEVYRAFQKLPIGTFVGLQTECGGRDYLGSWIDRAGGVLTSICEIIKERNLSLRLDPDN